MRDYLSIDTTPICEDCVPVSKDTDYFPAMQVEANRYKAMMMERFSSANGFDKICFRITRNPHDFGMYLDMIVSYDDADDDAMNQALFVESNLPRWWADEAKFKWDSVMSEGVLI